MKVIDLKKLLENVPNDIDVFVGAMDGSPLLEVVNVYEEKYDDGQGSTLVVYVPEQSKLIPAPKWYDVKEDYS